MIMFVTEDELVSLLERQINSFFSCSIEEKRVLTLVLNDALDRLETCLQSKVNNYMAMGGGKI